MRPSVIEILVPLCVGLVLVGLAFPRIGASLLTAPGDVVLSLVRAGRDVDVDTLRRHVRSREIALSFHESGRAWTDLALARLLLLEDSRVIRVEQVLPPIREELRRGLALAPANPHAWTRLLGIEAALGCPSKILGSISALAYETGAHEEALASVHRAFMREIEISDQSSR